MHVGNTGKKTVVKVNVECDVGMDDALCSFLGKVLTDFTDVVKVVPCCLLSY